MTDTSRCHKSPAPIVPAKPIELKVRGDFIDWLAQTGGSLATTTYNSGKLALFSAPNGELAASFWRFPRPMGLAYSSGALAIAAQKHLWLFRLGSEEVVSETIPPVPAPRREGLGRGDAACTRFTRLPSPPLKGERDQAYPINCGSSPHQLRTEFIFSTGRVDSHDLAFDRRGLAFVNTRYNCIARPSDRVSFLRTWQPWFIEGRPRTDCCHLNGLGVREGCIAMATAFCERGAPAAWREADRFQSGVLIDVRRNTITARGLCMPHSPRWDEGRWWFCDSGRGALCRLKGDAGWNEVAVLPGFTRGLTFAAGRAVVGLSRIRRRHVLDAPPVRGRFPRMHSGLWLVDPASGKTTGSLEFVRGGREVYDVVFLSGIDQVHFPPSDRESPI